MSETTPKPDTRTTQCGECGYTQEDAEIHGDHHLCKNRNPPWRKYFRREAIPGDRGTMMYWLEYEDGKNAFNIAPSNIPDGAIVTDITYEYDKRDIRKSGNTFVAA